MNIVKSSLIVATGIALTGCDPDMKITWTISDGECDKVMRGEIGHMTVEGVGELPYGNMTFEQAKTRFDVWKSTATNVLGSRVALNIDYIEGTNVAKFTASIPAAFGRASVITNAALPEVCQFCVATNGCFEFFESTAAQNVEKSAGKTCQDGKWDSDKALDGFGFEHRCWANLIAMRSNLPSYVLQEMTRERRPRMIVYENVIQIVQEELPEQEDLIDADE